MTEEQALCKKCPHRSTCRTPCRPVELMLRGDSPVVFEKAHRDERGRLLVEIWPRRREIPETDMQSLDVDDSNQHAQAFSTENGSAFASYADKAQYRQTECFIKRFFLNWSFQDIATGMDTTPKNVRNLYHHGVKKIFSILFMADQADKMTDAERRAADVAKQRRYLERNREKVNQKRRERYQQNKEAINAKRRAEYAKKQATD